MLKSASCQSSTPGSRNLTGHERGPIFIPFAAVNSFSQSDLSMVQSVCNRQSLSDDSVTFEIAVSRDKLVQSLPNPRHISPDVHSGQCRRHFQADWTIPGQSVVHQRLIHQVQCWQWRQHSVQSWAAVGCQSRHQWPDSHSDFRRDRQSQSLLQQPRHSQCSGSQLSPVASRTRSSRPSGNFSVRWSKTSVACTPSLFTS